MSDTHTPDPSVPVTPAVEEQSAFKPLLYVLVLPLLLIALLQWSDLPALLVHAITGH